MTSLRRQMFAKDKEDRLRAREEQFKEHCRQIERRQKVFNFFGYIVMGTIILAGMLAFGFILISGFLVG